MATFTLPECGIEVEMAHEYARNSYNGINNVLAVSSRLLTLLLLHDTILSRLIGIWHIFSSASPCSALLLCMS